MEKFKEIFSALNEGTQGAIIVKDKDGTYSMAYAQYDGYPDGVGAELKKYFNSDKDAQKIVDPKKTGEIRGIIDGEVEFYSDRKLLKTKQSEADLVEEANYFATHKYLWDGKKWTYVGKRIKSFSDINKSL